MDIVKRLHWLENDKDARDNLPPGLFILVGDAAAEIERLRAALQEIADEPSIDPEGNAQIARATLAAGKGEN